MNLFPLCFHVRLIYTLIYFLTVLFFVFGEEQEVEQSTNHQLATVSSAIIFLSPTATGEARHVKSKPGMIRPAGAYSSLPNFSCPKLYIRNAARRNKNKKMEQFCISHFYIM